MNHNNYIVADRVWFNMPLVRKGHAKTIRANPLAVMRDLVRPTRVREIRPLIREISFELHEGDRVGLMGQNGAGKTTLLRLLAGALSPSSGTLEIRGETQNLLNVSMGMQNDATGLENIYLRGYSAGLSGKEISARIPEILEFSQLESVIHDPVRTYSSGMQLRLAFAVATSVQPEILLLDEWISAGDRFFVQRSKERMMSHIDTSKMLVFASHSPTMLKELCTRGFVLKSGRLVLDGSIDEALEFYGSDHYQADEAADAAEA
jgi:lipopolysaccharide transport system ATP-binding protein